MPETPSKGGFTEIALGAGMAMLAGATDVHGLARLHDLFVSFMSGNTTMLAVAIGRGDWHRASAIAGVISAFFGGTVFGGVLGVVSGRAHRTVVSAAVAFVLAVPLLVPPAEVTALAFAMGALNASMSTVGGTSISLTYVTGALVKLGQGIGRAVCVRNDDRTWIWQLPMWASLLLGAVLATLLNDLHRHAAEWLLPGFASLLTIGAIAQRRFAEAVEAEAG